MARSLLAASSRGLDIDRDSPGYGPLSPGLSSGGSGNHYGAGFDRNSSSMTGR